ncbi:MAG: hypothetical protein DRO12_04375 [Thermoprotei archaeon]|nr:MAG: hypothetical protein DRO12_04375 [Thermoprotei archaeon]
MSEEVRDALKKATRVLWDVREAMGFPVLRRPLLELTSQLKMPHYHGSCFQMTEEPVAEVVGGEETTDDGITTMTPRPQIVYVKESRPMQTPVIDEVRRLVQTKALRKTVANLLRERFPEESKEKTEIVTCKECGKQWPKSESMKYCPACGASLEEKPRYFGRRARVTL